MCKDIVFVFCFLGLLSVCVADVVQLGQCASLNIQANFNIQSALGEWHEYFRTDNLNQSRECSSLKVTNDNGIEVQFSSVINNFLDETNGTVTQDGNSGRLTLSLSSLQDPIDVLVSETDVDYAFFAIIYSCEDISSAQRRLRIWVLTRVKEPTGMTIAFINTSLGNTFGFDVSALKSVDHSEDTCYVLPVIEPGNPIIFPGQCNENLTVVQNFEVEKFLGLWHQISSYETPNGNGSCARAEYSMGDGVVNILNSEVVDQRVLSIDGYATVNGTDAKLSVVLNIPGAPPTPSELWILRTDYNNYAIAYSCVNENLTHRRVYSWILSRSRQLSSTAQTAVNEATRYYLDLNSAYYKPTDQSDAACFFYPEPTDLPVVFRGQCESINVQALSNFEAEKYMGRWYNIEKYPSRFQDGTCSNAFYEIVDGNVTVVNSQVKDQSLETINGIAVPASDGSARLVVTFPVSGSNQTVSTDLWVLATDYMNYAFVYTCQNLNDDEMQVGSWKLSRTKHLSPASESAISDVMSNILYLDDRYFKKVDQSEEGCFYFPKPQENVPVVFPGQCDESVGVLQSFNLADLHGTWYEIESYPSIEHTAQCINHEFTFVDTTRLNLVSSGVTDQFLGEQNRVVTRSNVNDNSGRLTIAIADDNGTARNIPFWVLAASNDFVFAYGCENINNDFRSVWSWKLSRTTELTQTAVTAINNAMSNIIVLQDDYFEKIDHSNEACFYLPELEPGEPVVLPGPCDENITGIPNFNLERYTGRWRLIESYGSDFQTGTCNVARYTQQTGNVLEVNNSQVVYEQLVSISGTATLSSTGIGELRFYFPSRDEIIDIIILATDYASYSLGYGCVNLPNNRRRVYSWKMSRENTLSPEANNSMNEVIDKIPVLNNRFYYQIDRSDTGCFYLPTPDPSSPVRFRGQCDENITVVTNFQPERYLGRWFDVASYPEAFQDGKCNTAFYSAHPDSGIDVDVLNTQVIDQALLSVRGSAVLDPSDNGSAKLTVTFDVAGMEVSSNYWVLATDYISYAFVYSCRPVDDEYVQVTSWKLSRTRQLTDYAVTEIENVMATIRVLDERYFIARDQSPEGCFYFPQPQPGVPVVFPGQCDHTIAAQPNFNMKNFEGTWHEIAGYPKANQAGQCISQQFTLNENGNSMRLDSFSVFNLTQSTTEGLVTFATDNDTSGKLEITLAVNNGVQRIPYWILGTDYTDYALAYSCVNIDADTRGVWSWKLSRSRQLSTEGNVAIDNAVEKVDVLQDMYYENIEQTDAACFHLPDITPGDNVVLPGRCDPNIAGMPGFNLTRESCSRECQHGSCSWRCDEPCGRAPCDERCARRLPCGHRCRGLCGEPCPDICQRCRPDDFPTDFLGDQYEKTDKFIVLQDCKHILEVDSMDCLMLGDQENIQIRKCPFCRKPIINTNRYKDTVNKMFKNDINPIKLRVYGSVTDIQMQLKELRSKMDTFTRKYESYTEDYMKIMFTSFRKLVKTQNKVSLLQVEMECVYLNIFEMIVECWKAYRTQNITTLNDELQKHIKILLGVLKIKPNSKIPIKISEQQQNDLGNEIKRLNLMVQLSKLLHLALSVKDDPGVTQQVESTKDVVFSLSVFNEERALESVKRLQEVIKTTGVITKYERKMIVKAIGLKAGHWYKCPNGHYYCIGECGGANGMGRCPDCGATIGGMNHRLTSGNEHAPEMDGSSYAAWSEQNNMANFNLDDIIL